MSFRISNSSIAVSSIVLFGYLLLSSVGNFLTFLLMEQDLPIIQSLVIIAVFAISTILVAADFLRKKLTNSTIIGLAVILLYALSRVPGVMTGGTIGINLLLTSGFLIVYCGGLIVLIIRRRDRVIAG